MTTAIVTKYLCPTNFRGARVKASATSDRGPYLTLSWDYALNTDANHNAAAKELAVQLGWCGAWIAGDQRDSRIYVRPSSSTDLERATTRTCFSLAAFTVENDQPQRQCRTVARRA